MMQKIKLISFKHFLKMAVDNKDISLKTVNSTLLHYYLINVVMNVRDPGQFLTNNMLGFQP